jgi:uncharacterized Zn finger protein
MDSIVDYLVVIFFVVSFLSSIFKKKKKPEVKREEKPIERRTQDNDVMDEEETTTNSLEIFFKSINDELVSKKEEDVPSEVDEYYEQALLNSEKSEVTDNYTFQQTAPPPLIKEVIEPKEKRTHSIKSYSDSVNLTKSKHESERAKDFKNRLLQKESIKDFIIMNEILGKPKALQR